MSQRTKKVSKKSSPSTAKADKPNLLDGIFETLDSLTDKPAKVELDKVELYRSQGAGTINELIDQLELIKAILLQAEETEDVAQRHTLCGMAVIAYRRTSASNSWNALRAPFQSLHNNLDAEMMFPLYERAGIKVPKDVRVALGMDSEEEAEETSDDE